jgi:hypothetical protein
VDGSSWDPSGEAQAALRTIVTDPRYGPATLSNAPTMGSLLRSLLPGAPRETSVLVAAADAGVPWNLQSWLAQGMELDAASRVTAGALGDRTALTSDACTWAVAALATALGMGSAPDVDATRVDTPVVHDIPGADPSFASLFGSSQQPGTLQPPGRRRFARIGFASASSLRFAAAAMAGIGALLIIWACALPDAYFPAGDGRQSYSIFNAGSGGALWYALEPTGVAVIVAAIAVLIVVAARWAIAGWLTAGMLIAFGLQTMFFFAGYEFSVQHPARTGAAELVGILAALLLLAAGTLATVLHSHATTATTATTAPVPPVMYVPPSVPSPAP